MQNLPRPKVSRALRIPYRPQRMLGVALLTFLFVGVCTFSLIAYGQDWNSYNRLTQHGLTIQATVIRKEVDYAVMEGMISSPRYRILYRFNASLNDQMHPFEGKGTVSGEFYDKLVEGGSVEVVYDAANPSLSKLRSELAPPSIFRHPWLLVGLFAIMYLVIFHILPILRERNLVIRLVSEGTRTRAQVFDRWIEESGKDDDGKPRLRYFLAYAFKAVLPRGKTSLVTRAEMVTREEFQRTPIGSILQVVYLSEDPFGKCGILWDSPPN